MILEVMANLRTHKNFTLDELVFDLERIRKKTKFEKAHFEDIL
ncbi:MAG: hypothetical protein CM1200mP5_7060 [Candidatus Pelagibacterales bacterium]|nr:MAG: hypothetical protein CM1200mP5_7060 [Pelagibacterales bacterium]